MRPVLGVSSTDHATSDPKTSHAPNVESHPHSPINRGTQFTLCKTDLSREDLSGFALGQYALGRKIGCGGMGTVFAATHVHLDRTVAIKFLGSELSHSTEAHLRFAQEVLALGKLQHPNIVNAIDAGCVQGLKYLVTEMIDGDDLSQLIKQRGTIPVDEACELVYQAALGLAHSHRCGYIHRDIKPSNLIVNRAGVVKILDFGLVRTQDVDHHLTENGEMLGTWDFVAPEQAHDASQIDHRCDVYGLGCTLLFLLSGQVPFGAPRYITAAAKLRGHLFDMPAWLEVSSNACPPELRAVLLRMLAKSPSERYSTCDDVATALAPFTKHGQYHVIPAQAGIQSSSSSKSRDRSLNVTLDSRLRGNDETASLVDHSPVSRNRRSWRRTGLLLMLTVVVAFSIFVVPRTPAGAVLGNSVQHRPSPPSAAKASTSTSPVQAASPSIEAPDTTEELPRPSLPAPAARPVLQTLAPRESSNAAIPELDLFPSHGKKRKVPAER